MSVQRCQRRGAPQLLDRCDNAAASHRRRDEGQREFATCQVRGGIGSNKSCVHLRTLHLLLAATVCWTGRPRPASGLLLLTSIGPLMDYFAHTSSVPATDSSLSFFRYLAHGNVSPARKDCMHGNGGHLTARSNPGHGHDGGSCALHALSVLCSLPKDALISAGHYH